MPLITPQALGTSPFCYDRMLNLGLFCCTYRCALVMDPFTYDMVTCIHCFFLYLIVLVLVLAQLGHYVLFPYFVAGFGLMVLCFRCLHLCS
jgi:hypothetical protein